MVKASPISGRGVRIVQKKHNTKLHLKLVWVLQELLSWIFSTLVFGPLLYTLQIIPTNHTNL